MPLAQRLGRAERAGFLTFVLREGAESPGALQAKRIFIVLAIDDHLLVQLAHLIIGERVLGESLIELAVLIENLQILDLGAITDGLWHQSTPTATPRRLLVSVSISGTNSCRHLRQSL